MCYKNKVKNDKYNIDKTFPFQTDRLKLKSVYDIPLHSLAWVIASMKWEKEQKV
ncbi:hypothetical protein SAMN04488541_100819 [Thermoflexibacter ruber]|uniref:Uncharacterized protein n=1 Tax=Thermoflexibacter ruber TaxID=1003 RepID=A0A1I2DVL3_9BACT|nr:hypothetical protein SAMN04488541_100819 [Thermoflexibacter ruber]